MNIRKLIEHLENVALLSGEEQEVQIFDPDVEGWYGVTGMTYGGGDNIVKLFSDED